MNDTNDASRMQAPINRIRTDLHEVELRVERLRREHREAAEELDKAKSESASLRTMHGSALVELQEARASHERTLGNCAELIRSKDELSSAFAEKCAELAAVSGGLQDKSVSFRATLERAERLERELEETKAKLDAVYGGLTSASAEADTFAQSRAELVERARKAERELELEAREVARLRAELGNAKETGLPRWTGTDVLETPTVETVARLGAELVALRAELAEAKRDGEALRYAAESITDAEGRARKAEHELERARTELETLRSREAAETSAISTMMKRHEDAIRAHMERYEVLRQQADTINQRALALQASTIAVLPTGRLLQELEQRVPLLLVNDGARVGLVLGMIAELERTCALFAQHQATTEALGKALAQRPNGHGLIPDVEPRHAEGT